MLSSDESSVAELSPRQCGDERTEDVERTMSVLRSSQARYGNNSYYYAHTRSYDVPSEAKVVSGAGIITGGLPTLICRSNTPNESAEKKQPSLVLLERYVWFDNDSKVNIVLAREHLPPQCEGILKQYGRCGVEVVIEERSARISIMNDIAEFRLDLKHLNDRVDDEKSTWSLNDRKLMLSLKKIDTSRVWTNLRSTNESS